MMTRKHIEKQISEETFDWKKDSWYIAQYYPELFDATQYNWVDHSWRVAKHCPQHLDPERYNWKKHSHYLVKYCPEHFNASYFNWQDKFAVYMLRTRQPRLLLQCLLIVIDTPTALNSSKL